MKKVVLLLLVASFLSSPLFAADLFSQWGNCTLVTNRDDESEMPPIVNVFVNMETILSMAPDHNDPSYSIPGGTTMYLTDDEEELPYSQIFSALDTTVSDKKLTSAVGEKIFGDQEHPDVLRIKASLSFSNYTFKDDKSEAALDLALEISSSKEHEIIKGTYNCTLVDMGWGSTPKSVVEATSKVKSFLLKK